MKKWMSVFFVVAIAMIAGCTSAPIMNIEDHSVPHNQQGEPLSLEQVQSAIMKGAIQKGWTPSLVKEGVVEASILVRSHEAVVTIPYTQNDFDIVYKSSKNLDHADDKIHRNYNRWVANLAASIQEELIDEIY